MAASRSAGPERVAGRCRGGAAAGSGQNVPHPALPVVAARDVTVLPVPHATPGKSTGDPTSTSSPTASPRPGHLASEAIRLDRLNPQLKLEIQYVLQRRHDERQGKLTPHVVMRVVRMLADADVASLLDHDEDAWNERIPLLINDNRARGLFGYAYRAIADLAERRWLGSRIPARCLADAPPRLRRRPHPAVRRDTPAVAAGSGQTLDSLATVERAGAGSRRRADAVVVITRFARFLADIGITGIDRIDRSVLERYLADLRGERICSQRRASHIGLLNQFFAAVRQHRWDTTLPADAMFYPEDYPKRAERLPRALAEHVMAQLEHPDNLARFADPAHRLITIILMRCGLRITDALRLRADCVVADAEDAPYLRYYNHKMKRDALVPIDEQLRELIAEHRHRIAERWPAGTPGLFPRPTKNVDGTHPIASPTYRTALLALAGHLRHPRRTRPAGAPDSSSVAPYPRAPADQPRRPARGGAAHPRSRLRADDWALRPAARHHRASPVGSCPQGRHPRPHSHFGPRRAARRRRLGQATTRPRHPGPAQRLLRAAGRRRAARTPTPV